MLDAGEFWLAQGRHRQEALVGKLLRELEDEDAAAVSAAVGRAETGQASAAGVADPAAERLALSWRDGLLAGMRVPRSACACICFVTELQGSA